MDETPPRSGQGHGTRACYTSGCRRPECVAANTAYQRAYRAGERGTHDARLGPFKIHREEKPVASLTAAQRRHARRRGSRPRGLRYARTTRR